ncbi:MAG TPA: glycosyltransferase family 87 protein, partial [Ktedonobacteraceae bacterium]
MAQLSKSRWRWPLLCASLALIFLEIVWLAYLTPGEADLAHYACYGLTFWLGSHGANLLPQTYCAFLQQSTPQPLHMLPQEYPPLTVLLFSLPLLVPLPYYAFVFALLMTISAGLIYWLLARYETRQAALVFVLYLLLGAAGVFQERFDILPAACTLLCLLAAERGRWRTAYLALALGILLKLYPAVLLPALFLAEQRARGRTTVARWNWSNGLLCVGLVLAVMGGFALLNFQTAILSPLAYFLSRPPQIEALSASLVWLGGYFGAHYQVSFTFGSLNISSSLIRFISPVNTLLTVVGLLAIYWLCLRQRVNLAQAFVGLICVLIATGKVFSPQYLIWLIPLLACL